MAVGLTLLTGTVTSAAAQDHDVWGPGYKPCGSFRSVDYTIEVAAKGMSCRTARAIQREYWNGPRSRKKIVNGGSGCCGYTKLKRYPRYTCYSGAGAGSCRNARADKDATRVAAYEAKAP